MCKGNEMTPLKKIRIDKKLSIREVANAVDTDCGNLSRIENKRQRASAFLAEKLSKFYKGEISEIHILYPERFNLDI